MTDREFMEAAITAARKSRGDRLGVVPRVGAVAVSAGKIIGEAHRGAKEHAEYVLLQRVLPSRSLVNATVYTTLEPCTKRGKGKVPCVNRLIDRKVRRVVIGMLDPNPVVRGLGFRQLRLANIQTDMFPHDLMSQVESLNHHFVRTMESNPLHQATQEIAVLAVKARHDLQRKAVDRVLTNTVETLRRIYRGQVPIPGMEAGYFRHWLELVEESKENEHVRAYIRVAAFDPKYLMSTNWFDTFYDRVRELVKCGKLTIRYVFLLGTDLPTERARLYLDNFKTFAKEIRIVDQKGHRLSPAQLHPSIILFDSQKAVFTHDRSENTVLIEADEWIFKEDYARLSKQFNDIELASTIYFPKRSRIVVTR
jgi:pyrimidine deaminase RibD-like protein